MALLELACYIPEMKVAVWISDPFANAVRKSWKPLLFGVSVVVCSLLVFEITLAYLVSHPSFTAHLPSVIRSTVRAVYMHVRPTPQFLYGRHDAKLGYRMKEGNFPFVTSEFDTSLNFNSQGLRSSEDALRAPEIIFVGDSVTLGWGVESEETFAHRVAAELGWRGLNAGVSSYGTAREMMLLRQLDTSSLRWIVLQHHANDAGENRAFHESRGHLPVMSEELFGKVADREQHKLRFAKLPHFRAFLHGLINSRDEGNGTELSAEDQIAPFFEALASATDHVPSGVRLLLINSEGKKKYDSSFGRLILKEARTGNHPEWIKSMTFVDTFTAIKPREGFFLDPHPNAEQHAQISEAILKAIRASELEKPTRPSAAPSSPETSFETTGSRNPKAPE